MSKPVWFEPEKNVPFGETELNARLVETLKHKMSIANLFDMQKKMLSHVLDCRAHGRPDDIILCAPTGSGKTLAYALPILQILMDRIVPRLRAIVVVPTRDLAAQVAHVFKALTDGTSISISIITGATSIALEAQALVGCEVLIATPGRLVAHIQNGQDLDLTHVRYLVLDESDRLLQDSYDRWLETLMPLLGKSPREEKKDGSRLWRPSTGLLSLAIVPSVASMTGSSFGTASEERICKILVSATQSQKPTHMVHLDMRRPTLFKVKTQASLDKTSNDHLKLEQKYSVPSTLLEIGYVIKKIQEKPAALLYLLGWTANWESGSEKKPGVSGNGAKLIFTNSIESAHRLCRLLELCSYALGLTCPILEMSGELSAERRREVVNFVKGQPRQDDKSNMAPVVVCSDVLSRGMDIFTVDCVINYDAPAHVRTYLHRAGRTARAGRTGTVITLLLGKQMHHFRLMVHDAERGSKSVKTSEIRSSEFFTADVRRLLSFSLPALKRVLKREKLDLLPREQILPQYALHELCSHSEANDVFDRGDMNEDYVDVDDDNEYDLYDTDTNKRKRQPQDAHNGEDEGFYEDGDQRPDQGDDSVSDLLYAQIANNLMS